TETLSEAATQLRPVASELALIADYAAANLSRENPASPVCTLLGITGLPGTQATSSNLQQWLALCDLLLTGDGDWRKAKGITKRQGFPTKNDSTDPTVADLRKE